jgi:hypothetical protein
MAFRDNSTLITSAHVIDVVANNLNDTYVGTAGADTFVIANGDVGDDTLLGFENNDSLITHKKIYDGNNDGYISFGPNGVLDVDRTSSKFAGNDQLQLVSGGNDLLLLRYLGVKEGASDFVYADASTRDQLLGSFSAATGVSQTSDSSITQTYKFESNVSNDNFNAGTGSTAILFDNALGLNLGKDTITDFGDDDLLVFTSKIYDSNGNQIITFGGNKVLDLSGSNGPQDTDPATGPGGQLKIVDPNNTTIDYLGEKTINDVTYYYYGHHSTDLAPTGVHIV